MGKQRRQSSEQFKFKVALEAAKGLRTVNEIASDYDVHPNQVNTWKKQRECSAGNGREISKLRQSSKQRYTNKLGDSKWNWSG